MGRPSAISQSLLCLVAATSMAGCDSDGPLAAPARQAISARVLLLPPFEQSPEWRDVGRGISQYFEHLEGFQLEILAPPSRPKNYPTAIQHALESKPDVVVLPMHDTETMRPFASLVAQRGATLITYGDPADVRGVFGHVEVNWLVGIGELASRLPEIAAPSHSYVLIHNNGGSAAGAARYERFTTQAARQFAVTRLDECDLFEAKLDPGTAIRRMLARFRSTGIVVSLDSGFWGRMTDETINELPCRFVATGAPPEVWRWLENGKAAALVGVNSAELGRELGRLIIQATEGGTGSDSSRVVSAQVITRDNLADFRRRYADALGQKNADFKPAPAADQHAP